LRLRVLSAQTAKPSRTSEPEPDRVPPRERPVRGRDHEGSLSSRGRMCKG
jgi:hypothetical protein